MKEMKIVSFKVAQELKENGYSQNHFGAWYDGKGDLHPNHYSTAPNPSWCFAPTVFEAFIWLWKERDLCITFDEYRFFIDGESPRFPRSTPYESPEDAVEDALEYLVDENLMV